MLAVVISLLDNLRTKRVVGLTKQVMHLLKILGAHQLKIPSLNESYLTSSWWPKGKSTLPRLLKCGK